MPDEHQESCQTQKPAGKKLIRRDDRDHSQPLRFTVQILFAALNLWIGVQFYLWVHWAESGGRALEVSRPAGVEGWLPIEGLMQLKYFLITGKSAGARCGFLPVYLVPGYFVRLPQGVLQLVVSGRNRLGISVEVGPGYVSAETSNCHAGRHRVALAEVPPVELLRLRGSQHVGRGHRRFSTARMRSSSTCAC